MANEETDRQLEVLDNLPVDAQVWDVILGARNDIMNIKVIYFRKFPNFSCHIKNKN
jgi:hypothetical protein